MGTKQHFLDYFEKVFMVLCISVAEPTKQVGNVWYEV